MFDSQFNLLYFASHGHSDTHGTGSLATGELKAGTLLLLRRRWRGVRI